MKGTSQAKLEDALNNLKGSKITERREALSSLRTIFERSNFLDNFHATGKHAWLAVFESLFSAVRIERDAANKAKSKTASTNTAHKRLEDVASTIRWLIERAVHRLNTSTTRKIFPTLLQQMVDSGQLFAPVALHYIKALRCLVGYAPHLDHIEDDTWVRMLEMGFNTLLGDPIRSTFDDDDDIAPSPVDSDMFDEDETIDDTDVLPTPSRKRARSDSNSTPGPSARKSTPQPKRKIRSSGQITVSQEQVEFMSVVSALLQSTSSPILSPDFPSLASSILVRLQRFLDMYTGDTSLLYDYVVALSSTLSHLSLNRAQEVAKFARKSWDRLVSLWGTKNKRIKEGLVSVLRVLISFVTSDDDTLRGTAPFDCFDGLRRLSVALDGEAESRWGIDGLSLDSLRLELSSFRNERAESSAFVASTFRFGWNFDSNQALAWAILELQADCIAKLFQISESIHHPSTPGNFGEGKRLRLENPIASLLTSIQHRSTSNVRAYHLQILLFVIDRHWGVLHDTLQQEVISTLLQFVSLDDGSVQSWVFLCFAAIAFTIGFPSQDQSSRLKPLVQDSGTWDSIWTNAIRRASVPTVSRAACHTAYIILTLTHADKGGSAHIPLPSPRVLVEIETLAKDLDVQGPPYPFDSVCAFLACCLKVASQDMHLYRMQLEEKALSWLVDCWKVATFRSKKQSLHMASDLMLLLESICGFGKRSDLVSRVPLPQGQISKILTDEAKTKVIKDFLLCARIPPFHPSETRAMLNSSLPAPHANDKGLIPPRGRERRITAFLLKSIESLLVDWDESTGHSTAETARQSLDLAVTALSFESSLVLNGTQANRRLIQCACKLIGTVTTLLCDVRWTVAERALICLGLDPLICLENDLGDDEPWGVMLPPDMGSGIKAQALSRLSCRNVDGVQKLQQCRMHFLRIVWQHPDVQSAFMNISTALRDLLCISLGSKPTSQTGSHAMDIDEQDGFEPIRTATEQHSTVKNESSGDGQLQHFVLDVCISFLVVGPALLSVSGEPTRDKELLELVLACAEPRPESFLSAFPIILQKCRQGTLKLSVQSLDNFLDELHNLLVLHHYAKSHRLQSLSTQLLASTLDIWAVPEVPISEATSKVADILGWLSGALHKKKIRSWVVRDLLAKLFDRYLARNPTENTWNQGLEALKDVPSPSVLLPTMGSDDDIRVRFRVAVLNARLFALARHKGLTISHIYMLIKKQLTVDLDNYEHMLTRILSLGNTMVVGSHVRRGAYWHLLETCLHTSRYHLHIEVVLRGVSERMGLPGLSSLFEAYASQMAFSIQQSGFDFLRFPPHILGYQERKECAAANFRSFTPTNIWNEGQKLFENHCKVLSKSMSEGIRICFGDILGYRIASWTDEHYTETDGLEESLRLATFEETEFDQCLAQNVDTIAASILKTFKDDDFSENGPVIKTLRTVDPSGYKAGTFQRLMRYRGSEEPHPPNLPAFHAETVLQALDYLRSLRSDLDDQATTYHILHQLFTDIDVSPLVNEQIRLINAICLWIAIHPQDFQEITLLHTLIHGATALLGQSDLARSAQSILDWAFSCYRKFKTKHPRIPDILVRICCVAYDYSQASADVQLASMGAELLKWTDHQASKLAQVPVLATQVMRALPAWPHQPSPELARLSESITGEHLSSVLKDPYIASSKFRLVRRLRDYAVSNEYNNDHFAQVDFWRLKNSIPQSERLQDADIDAFVDLLMLNKGRLDSFNGESSFSRPKFEKHSKNSKNAKDELDQTQEPIILILLAMVQGDSTSQSTAAYETLRLIKSVAPKTPSEGLAKTTEHDIELGYLEKYQRPPRAQATRDINELVSNEQYLDLVQNFPKWVASITTLLSDVLSAEAAFYSQLSAVLQSDTPFAEQILPILVYTILATECRPAAESNRHRGVLSDYFTSVLSSQASCIQCLRSVIDVVLHLRHFNMPTTVDHLSYNKWLDIDFILLSRSSISCGMYTTALLFLELAAETRGPIDYSEGILYEIYRHIDEPDGFYGIHDSNLHQNLLKRFHHENQWELAFRFHGAAFEAGDMARHTEGLVKSFHSFGFDHLANDALRTASHLESNGGPEAISYRLAWRTQTWDLPECDERSPGASLYLALRSIYRERDESFIDTAVRGALSREMDRLRALGPENFAEIREVIQDLMCLHEVANWRHASVQACLKSKDLSSGSLGQFTEIDPDFEFFNLENIMATRISLVRASRQKAEREQIGTLMGPFAQGLINIENRCLVRLSQAARAENQIQVALNSIVRAQKQEKVPSFSVHEEFANVLWCHKEEKIAVESLEMLPKAHWKTMISDSVCDHEKALVLARLGSWSSKACLKKPEDIQADYFRTATDLVLNESKYSTSSASQKAHATVYHESAIFAERQYSEIVKSPDAIRWKIYVGRKTEEIKKRQAELKLLASDTHAYKSLNAIQLKAQKLLYADVESSRKYYQARDTFLKQAISMYARSLQVSDLYDGDAVIRLCSLWFANFENDTPGLQEDIRTALELVPSRKVVFLSHQLTARISTPAEGDLSIVQKNLQQLVFRMCKEHPFHSLYQVYCLKPTVSSSKRQSIRITSPPTYDERAAAAHGIFDRLRGTTIPGNLKEIEQLCDACVGWAKFSTKGKELVKYVLQGNIRKIRNLRVPVITHHTPLDPTLLYNDCPWIDHYESAWKPAGGVNNPKISVCVGTDGIKYIQLFKGEGDDDLRQDAVMEQVFDLVNGILRRDRDTRRRQLNVRDYKVIPLAPQAGIIEFVGNTIPLSRWLPSAHRRYYPKDIAHEKISPALGDGRKGMNDERRIQVFRDMQKRVHPVMRHFFTEMHKTPIAWFAMRLNYTRTVATSSIVGHILGLGDRHTSNILIDIVSGQIVHIDLGIAFDQGKLLPIPELVPFRMTRDMVDGMGTSGTSGVFQRCAEETLRVLRDGSEVIMTVLEVFKHDPLHSWTASDTKIQRAQKEEPPQDSTKADTTKKPEGSTDAKEQEAPTVAPKPEVTANTVRPGLDIGIDMKSGNAEEAADRALNSVARKLDKSLSVQSAVNQLVTEATDVRNLGLIFQGKAFEGFLLSQH
ncbi:hypothetical protein H0H81_000486 [Sphagnurus paluster]|uniref:Serine/threonine-protein kinase TEL1 n=1 Tax=Sphagnurus paluster TaxID=117069 RepID=A0A9P7K621_9AGAR|nr:hypothetical protein H0H81_000486 [Sphagnurus paluster]